MSKKILLGQEARVHLKKGVDTLAASVIVTLGPAGRNVMIERPFGSPLVTKDGVSVAKEILITDRTENMGAQFVKEAASKTNEKAGDGTSTATVLTQAIYAEGLGLVEKGHNPVYLMRGINIASQLIIEELKKYTKVIGNTGVELSQIAHISANSDATIGDMIGEAYSKVGKEGVIAVEQSTNAKTYVELVEGMKFGGGYAHQYFTTDRGRDEVQLKDVMVVITEDKITKWDKHLIKAMDRSVGEGKALLIIGNVELAALETLLVNKVESSVKVSIANPPGFGDRRKDYLEDIAYVLGGKVISKVKGKTLSNMSVEDFGTCSSVISDYHDTVLTGGGGTKEMIEFRVAELEQQMKNAENDYETKQFESRIASLKGGVGVIYVGAPSEAEMKEKMDRIEDAKNATKAALQEGIVCGGGIALLQARKSVDVSLLKGDELLGAQVLLDALISPFVSIVGNAGVSVKEQILAVENLAKTKINAGFDAKEMKIVDDMIAVGIIDPVKVTRIALENAASAAGMLLTTECTVTTILDSNPQQREMF